MVIITHRESEQGDSAVHTVELEFIRIIGGYESDGTIDGHVPLGHRNLILPVTFGSGSCGSSGSSS